MGENQLHNGLIVFYLSANILQDDEKGIAHHVDVPLSIDEGKRLHHMMLNRDIQGALFKTIRIELEEASARIRKKIFGP